MLLAWYPQWDPKPQEGRDPVIAFIVYNTKLVHSIFSVNIGILITIDNPCFPSLVGFFPASFCSFLLDIGDGWFIMGKDGLPSVVTNWNMTSVYKNIDIIDYDKIV